MSVEVAYTSRIKATETLATGVPAANANNPLVHDGFDTNATLDGANAPTATAATYQTVTLTAGAATIDLTAMTGVNGAAVSHSGKKVRVLKVKNPAANPVTISKGASNGYTGLGANFSVAVPAGGEVTFYDGGNGVAVSGTVKTLDLAGTGTNQVKVAVVVGD